MDGGDWNGMGHDEDQAYLGQLAQAIRANNNLPDNAHDGNADRHMQQSHDQFILDDHFAEKKLR